ncbi:MAG: TolC family protein [Phycisphaerae bacterium]|nr:TolC family protein [Phycisphaerae bacterium]
MFFNRVFGKCQAIYVSVVVLLLAGCSTSPPNTGLENVQRYSSERTIPEYVLYEDHLEQTISNLMKDELTITEAVQIALLKNPFLQAKLEELDIVYADMVQAGLLSNPVFAASARFPDGPPSGTNTEFSVTQNFLDILVLPLKKKLAGIQYEQTQLILAQEILKLVADVRRSYFTLQGAYHYLNLQKELLNESEASVGLAEKQYEAGNINELELISFQKDYQKAQICLMKTQSQVFEQRSQFCGLLGLDCLETDWKIQQELPELFETGYTLEQFKNMAVANRIDLSIAHNETQMIQEAIAMTRQGVFETIEVGVDTERDTDRTVLTGPILSIGLPIFDQKQAAIARKEAQLKQSQKQAQAIEQSVLLEVWTAFNQLDLKTQIAKRYKESVISLQQRTMELSKKYYNNMLIGPYALLSAKREEIETKLEYADIQTQCWLAFIDLENAVGKTLIQQVVQDKQDAQEHPAMPIQNEHHNH